IYEKKISFLGKNSHYILLQKYDKNIPPPTFKHIEQLFPTFILNYIVYIVSEDISIPETQQYIKSIDIKRREYDKIINRALDNIKLFNLYIFRYINKKKKKKKIKFN